MVLKILFLSQAAQLGAYHGYLSTSLIKDGRKQEKIE